MNKIKLLWHKLSRLGLHEDEGVFGHREVILLNKVLIVAPFVVGAIIPFEIYYNGFTTLPLELALIGLMIIPLVLHHYRWFYISQLVEKKAKNL